LTKQKRKDITEKDRAIRYEARIEPDSIKKSYKHMSDLMKLQYDAIDNILEDLHKLIDETVVDAEVQVFDILALYTFTQKLYDRFRKFWGNTLNMEKWLLYQEFLQNVLLNYIPMSEEQAELVDPAKVLRMDWFAKEKLIDYLKIFTIPVREVWRRTEMNVGRTLGIYEEIGGYMSEILYSTRVHQEEPLGGCMYKLMPSVYPDGFTYLFPEFGGCMYEILPSTLIHLFPELGGCMYELLPSTLIYLAPELGGCISNVQASTKVYLAPEQGAYASEVTASTKVYLGKESGAYMSEVGTSTKVYLGSEQGAYMSEVSASTKVYLASEQGAYMSMG